MSIAKGLVLDLDLILEIALQLIVGLWREIGNAIARLQAQFTNVRQLIVVWRRQTERILETVGNSRITLQKVIQTLGESGDDHHGIILPFIHLDKELIQGIHLIGILIGQQFLDIVKE